MRRVQNAECRYTAYGYSAGGVHLGALLGFNGERADILLWAYILGNGRRAYSPELMRFHSPDIFSPFAAGGLNVYAYCAGDPVNFNDPSGQFRRPKVSALRGLGKFSKSLLQKSKVPVSVLDDSRLGDVIDGALVPPAGKQKPDRHTSEYIINKTILGARINKKSPPSAETDRVTELEVANKQLLAELKKERATIVKLEEEVAKLRKGGA